MIRHLNQVNFHSFGTVLSEKAQASPPAEESHTLFLSETDIPIYRAVSPTRLSCESGLTILSVSKDSGAYEKFYLDKSIVIHPDIYFSLTPFRGNAAVRYCADIQPTTAGILPKDDSFQLKPQLRVDAIYTFFYHEKEQGFLFPGESHPMLELTYVDQGSLHCVADGQDLILQQGDLVLYGADQWHMQYADIDVAPRYVTISFEISGGDLSALFNQKFRCPQKTVSFLQQMLREQERMDEHSGDMIVTLLEMVLLTLQREVQAPAETLRSAHCLNNENEIIRRAQQYISENMCQKLTVPLVARNADVSTSYLTALFHKHLQISPGEYIRRIKLQQSKQMIREGKMNFTEIAEALQYSTIHHFSRQFKEKFGITPSEYAKSIR